MTSGNLLRFEDVAVSYAGRAIFRAASLALGPGIYALQGPNGSGKSTLLRLLAGAQQPDSGHIWIDGHSLEGSPLEARQRLSYAPDESPVYPFVTGREFLRFVAAAKGVELDANAMRLVETFGALPLLDVRFDTMSLGAQKKLLLCAAWIGAPRVILLDEPSNGLDQAARVSLAKEMQAFAPRSTVFFATHDTDFIALAGASVIAFDEVCIIDRGARTAGASS